MINDQMVLEEDYDENYEPTENGMTRPIVLLKYLHVFKIHVCIQKKSDLRSVIALKYQTIVNFKNFSIQIVLCKHNLIVTC